MSTPDAAARLGELARAARWSFGTPEAWYGEIAMTSFIDDDDEQVIPDEDAAYIAAASPSVILALLERTAELEAALRRIVESQYGLATGVTHGPPPRPEDFTFYVSGVALEAARAALAGEAEP